MSFLNSNIGTGGLALVNKRNVIFELSFTVEDPGEHGFLLRIDELMKGISSITLASTAGGTAIATGLGCLAEYDDSTDALETYSLIGSFVGTGTSPVQTADVGTVSALQERSNTADLGPYYGTTSFVLRFNSLFTPTTNVVFPNNGTGSGFVMYGYGEVPPGFDEVEAADLGHFLTITAAFNTPCSGDVNGDDMVNLQDLNLVLANFGANSLDGDANLDGEVDLSDLNTVLAAFGTNCG